MRSAGLDSTGVRGTRMPGSGRRGRHRGGVPGRVAHRTRQSGGEQRGFGVHLRARGGLPRPVQVDADDRVHRFGGRYTRAVHEVLAVLGHGVSRAGAVVRHPFNDRPGATIRSTLPIGLHRIAAPIHGA